MPGPRLVVVTLSGAGLIVSDRLLFEAVPAGLAESVTVIVTLDMPAAMGVPVI